jgi:5-methyltetrahydrofolate--homocysteine methyltransferase
LKTNVYRKNGKSVDISHDLPIVLIGEKINPTGKKSFVRELLSGDLSRIRQLAIRQSLLGAQIIDVNVGVEGVDEVALLVQAVQLVMEATDLPLSIDSANAEAMDAALSVYQGKAILNSITGEEEAMAKFLPLVKKHNSAFIALCYDDSGIDSDPAKRMSVAKDIILRAEKYGIQPEDVIIDPIALPVATDSSNAIKTLNTIKMLRSQLDQNITLGVSNISFGLPDRKQLNLTMLLLAIAAGVNCPIVDPTLIDIRKLVLAADLLLGKDEFAVRWIQEFRTKISNDC